MTKTSFKLLALTLACLCTSQGALASQYPAECADIAGAYKMADAAAKATVDKVEVTKETGGNIFTTVYFTINEYVKGNGETNIKFRRLGGTLDGVTVSSGSNLPEFKEGQQGYLLLTKQNDLYFPTCDYGLVDVLPDLAQTGK